MGPVTILLGIAAALAALATLAGPSRRRDFDDAKIAAALLGVWFFGAICQMVFGTLAPATTDAHLYVAASMDALTGFYAVSIYRRRATPAPWLRTFILLVGLQIILHAAFGFSDKSHVVRYGYALGLNVSFLAELLCAASPGVRYGLRALRRGATSRPRVLRERGTR